MRAAPGSPCGGGWTLSTGASLADDRLRAQMGRNGRQYVKTNYRWDVILQKYEGLMAALKG